MKVRVKHKYLNRTQREQNMVERYSYSPEETIEIGKQIGRKIANPIIFSLEGDLGSGKTLLTKGVAKGLGIEELITSPSYTLANEYENGRFPLIHIDLYRLKDMDELLELGWESWLRQNAVLIIEWGDRFDKNQGKDWIHIHIQVEDTSTRRFTITPISYESWLQ
jgi:tRNA threonylcarbamoyladenosine biosynthesis protein TsaE